PSRNAIIELAGPARTRQSGGLHRMPTTGPGGYLVDALRNVKHQLRQATIENVCGELAGEKINGNALLKRLEFFEQFQHYHYTHEEFVRALEAAGISVARRARRVEVSAV
ncbi:hypothetical protein, partial [Bradyrhizobium sp. CCBAU 45389]|uniref:hypothetical protein n=1 Tax=Bradyrhizobium sp. CCBAU 45389 TaxID=858429 RepID=UPI0023051F7E